MLFPLFSYCPFNSLVKNNGNDLFMAPAGRLSYTPAFRHPLNCVAVGGGEGLIRRTPPPELPNNIYLHPLKCMCGGRAVALAFADALRQLAGCGFVRPFFLCTL